MLSGQLTTAGERVAVHVRGERWFRLLRRAAGTGFGPIAGTPTVVVELPAERAPFATAGLRRISRDAYGDGVRSVLHNAGGSGFDLQVQVSGEVLYVVARYRPAGPLRAANTLLSTRFTLLAGQILLHYPALWRAGWRGRVPLHVAAFGSPGVLVAGPAGVGKSTLVAAATSGPVAAATSGPVAAATSGPAAAATSGPIAADNLCAADGLDCYGVAEPVRLEQAGRRTSHGRGEQELTGRPAMIRPELVAVLERGPRTELVPAEPADAARALIAGTYAAGELRRYWQFAATLALATGTGPAHPPVAAVAGTFAERLPCWRFQVAEGERPDPALLTGLVRGPGESLLTITEEPA